MKSKTAIFRSDDFMSTSNIVLYFYIYPKVYEKQKKKYRKIRFKYKLLFESAILELLAASIIGGIAYDSFKALIKSLRPSVTKCLSDFDEHTQEVFTRLGEDKAFFDAITKHAKNSQLDNISKRAKKKNLTNVKSRKQKVLKRQRTSKR